MKAFATLVRIGMVGLAGSVLPLPAASTELNHVPPTVDLPATTAPRRTEAPAGNDEAPPELALTARFDRDHDGVLDATERRAARDFLRAHPPAEPAPADFRSGEPPVTATSLAPVKTGRTVEPGSSESFPDRPLYDPLTLRTLFLDFADHDWEQELSDFARTDILVPVRLTLDGQVRTRVGVHLRTRPAEDALPPGYQRSFDLFLDYGAPGQSILGQQRLRLLACPTDPTLLRTVLYRRVAGEYLPTPRANFVRVVINGEDWGIYVNEQPLDENFIRDAFRESAGAWWVVTGGANLAYRGDQPDSYRAHYRLQSAEDPAAWAALIKLCRTIARAKPGEFETEAAPMLDLDGALRFFALENAFINQDGYGSRGGGFGLYLDPRGVFHLVPLEAEASFRLVQASDYERANRQSPGDEADRGTRLAEAYIRERQRARTPHPAESNLAMLLSYSFVNKADTDSDEKLSRQEWHDFALSWFVVMDEDMTGRLTRDQFIAKVRQVVTPPSLIDGRSRQSYGQEDPAAMIGQDLFDGMDANKDGLLTRDEMIGAFDRWFAEWTAPKAGPLTQPLLQDGFTKLFSRSVFTADKSEIKAPSRTGAETGGKESRGGGREGRRGGRERGSGLNVGPLHLGGRGGRGDDSRTLVTFGEELDPLAGQDDPTRPLLGRLLAAPALRDRYLQDLDDLAGNWLDWSRLGPPAQACHDLIADEVAKATHQASTYEHFVQDFNQPAATGPREGAAESSLKEFVNERGAFLRRHNRADGGD